MRRLCPDTETKKTMNPTDRIHIDRLCERIQKETDPMLFTELVIELNHFLERNECQQRATRLNGAAGMALPEQNPYLQFRTRRWLSDLLGATIVATDADFGDVQLFDSTCGALRIVAHEGFENEFLEYFETVDCSAHCPCGAAMSKHSRVVVGGCRHRLYIRGRVAGNAAAIECALSAVDAINRYVREIGGDGFYSLPEAGRSSAGHVGAGRSDCCEFHVEGTGCLEVR